MESKHSPKNSLVRNRRFRKVQQLLLEGSYFKEDSILQRHPQLSKENMDQIGDEDLFASSFRPVLLGDALLEASEALRGHKKHGGLPLPDPPLFSASNPPVRQSIGQKDGMSDMVRVAVERFLLGWDSKWIDYDKVDQDSDFDDLAQIERDEQDAYFSD